MAHSIHASLIVLAFSIATLGGCGGGQGEAQGPNDADDTSDGSSEDADGASDDSGTSDDSGASDDGGGDGIIRDADGDGVPDKDDDVACEGKNETQCKINMACAWSDANTCVKASSSPM